jgi:predicted metalloprotease with PDZ domain
MILSLRFAIIPAFLLTAMPATLCGTDAPVLPGKSDSTVRMAPYYVRTRPLTSFGLALQMEALVKTKQVLRMFIREVEADSEADFGGLVPGTEILSVDGRNVRTFAVRFDPESDLGRLFVNRARGDRIRLVVIHPGAAKPRTVELVVGRTREYRPGNIEWPW